MRLINSSDMKATISGHFKGFSYEFLDKVLLFIVLISASARTSKSERKQLLLKLFIINKAISYAALLPNRGIIDQRLLTITIITSYLLNRLVKKVLGPLRTHDHLCFLLCSRKDELLLCSEHFQIFFF